jgi:hypothetical protein
MCWPQEAKPWLFRTCSTFHIACHVTDTSRTKWETGVLYHEKHLQCAPVVFRGKKIENVMGWTYDLYREKKCYWNLESATCNTVRPGVHATIKSVSVPAPISFFPEVKPRSAVHTDRQNRYRRLQGGQFREWCRAVNMAPMWNRSFYVLCLLHPTMTWFINPSCGSTDQLYFTRNLKCRKSLSSNSESQIPTVNHKSELN